MADEKTITKEDLDKAVTAAVAKMQESLDKLETKNGELLDETKRAKAELRKVKEISPEDMVALESENEKLRVDLNAATKAAKEAGTERDKAVKALETEGAFTQKLLIQDGIKSALLANGVKDEDFIDSLTAKFASGAKVVVEGDERKAVYDGKPLGDFIKEWAGSDTGKKFVEAPNNSGGGAGGGGTKSTTQKTMPASQFNSLPPKARAAFIADGGAPVEAAA